VYGTDGVVDDFELALARAAVAHGTPLLAICRGIQVLNVAFGGTLHQHIPADPGVAPHGEPGAKGGARLQRVELEPDSRIAAVMGTTAPTVSCHHHQAIDRVGTGLRVVGRAADGIVEAIEPVADDAFVLAVQWHPEDTAATDPAQQALFTGLVERARSQ
jgi:putative glutamine amidotransferase